MATNFSRVTIIVLDSAGCGAAPDAKKYGDEGSDTIGNTSRAVGGLKLPHLQALGLGNIGPIQGVPAVPECKGAWGRMREKSAGKDTTTGHWEMAGLELGRGFNTFPHGFPDELIKEFTDEIGRTILGNKPASGTEIIKELGAEHVKTGQPIVYTSADSVFQVAAHEEIIPVPELYRICEIARRLCTPRGVARVIARPFVGKPGNFTRTYNRKDFSLPPSGPTILEAVSSSGKEVVGVGKIGDIFSEIGLTASHHTEGNADGIKITQKLLRDRWRGLLFVNLVDFDMLYGHRRDPQGYASALEEFDRALPELYDAMNDDDLLLLTADHGTDPTFPGTDHTREDVPLIAYHHGIESRELGVRQGFFDLAQTLSQTFALPAWVRGTSFLDQLK